MYISKISISNYKSISEKIEINFSKDKTVFVGKNNSGKSNVLSVLNIFFGDKYPAYYKFDEEDFFDREKPIELEMEVSDITQEEKNSFVYQDRFKSTDKGRITSNGNRIYVRLTSSKEGKNQFEVSGGANKSASDPNLKGVNANFWNSLCSYVYIPADRSINSELRGNSYSWYGKLLHLILDNKKESDEYKKLIASLETVSSNFNELINLDKAKEISKTLTYIEDIKISLSESSKPEDLLKKIEILAKSEGLDFQHISRLGTGTQSSIILGLLEIYLETLSENNSSVSKIFVVDEPENFLHPQAKRLINQVLEDLSKNTNTQVIYSTHSSELVSSFEEDGFQLSDIKLVYKNGVQTKLDQFSEEDNEKYSKVITNLSADNAEIFFASKVLLVEGETEKYSIPNIFKYKKWGEEELSLGSKDEYELKSESEKQSYLKQEFNLDYKNISIINVEGKNGLPKWFEFCSRIIQKENVYCLIDKDPDFETKDKKQIIKSINTVFGVSLEEASKIDFEAFNWLILEKGEFESYYQKEIIKQILEKKIEQDCENIPLDRKNEVITNKKQELEKEMNSWTDSDKISKKYEDLFDKYIQGLTKPAIAYKLSKYLIENDGFDAELIKVLKKVL